MTLVPLDAIVVKRTFVEESDISGLVSDMKKNGLKRPILVRQDMTLIDGLRRLQAAQQLNWQQIEAVVTDNINEVKKVLMDTIDQLPEPRRLYEFHLSLKKLFADRRDFLRNSGQWALDTRAEVEEVPSYREFCVSTLKIPYTSYLSRVNFLYNLALSGDRGGIEFIRQIETGEITVGSAYHRLSDRAKLTGDIESKAEQRLVLSQAARNLGVLVTTLNKLGSPLKVPTDEASALVKEIHGHYGQLKRVLLKIKREIEKGNE